MADVKYDVDGWELSAHLVFARNFASFTRIQDLVSGSQPNA